MPKMGIDMRVATAATCASAIVRIAGPDRPPVPAPSHGPGAPGAGGRARSVLISETASAPPSSDAWAQAATSAVAWA